MPKLEKKSLLKLSTGGEFSSINEMKAKLKGSKKTEVFIEIDSCKLLSSLDNKILLDITDDGELRSLLINSVGAWAQVKSPKIDNKDKLTFIWDDMDTLDGDIFDSLLDDINLVIQKKVDKLISCNQERYDELINEKEVSEASIFNENEIKNLVIKKLTDLYPSTRLIIMQATNLPACADMSNNDSRQHKPHYMSLNKLKVVRDEQIRSLEDNNIFDHYEFPECENKDLIEIYLSESFLAKYKKLCQEKTDKYYDLQSEEKKNKFKQEIEGNCGFNNKKNKYHP